MTTDVARARRLATAIVADLELYETAAFREGPLDQGVLPAAVAEGLELFRMRVAAETAARLRSFDAALVRAVLRVRQPPLWQSGLDRLRAQFTQYPACAACGAGLSAPQAAFHGEESRRSLLLLSCAACRAITGVTTDLDGDELDVHLEAGASVVVRLVERLREAKERESLETEVAAIEADPALARLLGAPELSSLAAPATGVLVAAEDLVLRDDPGWAQSRWPIVAPRLFRREDGLAPRDGRVAAGTRFTYLGRVPGGWRLGAPLPSPGVEWWSLAPVVTASRALVELREG